MKVTLTFEGDLEEFPVALQELVKAKIGSGLPGHEEARGKSSMTHSDLLQLRKMISSDAWLLLVEIARRPGGYPFSDLLQAMKLKGMDLKNDTNSVAGRLSSIGRHMPKFPTKEHPVRRDTRERRYSMDPEIAAAILEIDRAEKGNS